MGALFSSAVSGVIRTPVEGCGGVEGIQLLLLTSLFNFYVRPGIKANNLESDKFKAACNALFNTLIHLLPTPLLCFCFCLFPFDLINHIRTATSTG